MAGMRPRIAVIATIAAAVIAFMVVTLSWVLPHQPRRKPVRGRRLEAPAEAEDVPSLSLADSSLWCPSRTLPKVSLGYKLYVHDHSDWDVQHRVNLVAVFDA